MIMIRFSLLLLAAMAAFAQPRTQALVNQRLTKPILYAYHVSNLPTSGDGLTVGALAVVDDAVTPGSCGTGGGTSLALCRWSGSSWVSLGGAAGGEGGDVTGPEGVTADRLAAFDGVTGKLLKDAGYNPADFALVGAGVTNGDSHDHSGGDGAQVPLGSGVGGTLPVANGGTNQTVWVGGRCVQVNPTGNGLESAPAACGTGGGGGTPASGDFTDFGTTVSTDTVTVATGRARIGNYAPVVIAAGSAQFTAGSGDVKIFIDQNNNLVCLMATGIAATTSGSMVCSNAASPAYPANSIPIADLTVAAGTFYPSIDSDDRAFFSTRAISAGTGIAISDTGGMASVAIDGATVPTFGGDNVYTGSQDSSAATKTAPAKTGTSLPATCSVGDQFFKSDATAGSNLYGCTATDTWTAQGGGGGGAPTDAQYLALATNAGLSAERVLTPGAGMVGVDAGANGAYTLSFNPFDRTVARWIEDFMGGLATTGNIGSSGWALTNNNGNAQITTRIGEVNHPGIVRVATQTTSGNDGSISLRNGTTTNDNFRLDDVAGWEFQWIVRPNQSTNVSHFIGFSTSGVMYSANRIVVKFESSTDSVWKFAVCNTGTCTTSDSTIAPGAGTWARIRIRSTAAGTILFSVDGESEVSISTNLPTANLSPGVSVKTGTTAESSIDVDWFAGQLVVTR